MKNKLLSIVCNIKNFFDNRKIETSIACLAGGVFIAATSSMIDETSLGAKVRSYFGIALLYIWLFLFSNISRDKLGKLCGTFAINFVLFIVCGTIVVSWMNLSNLIMFNIIFCLALFVLIFQFASLAVFFFKASLQLFNRIFGSIPEESKSRAIRFIERFLSLLLTASSVAFTIVNLWFIANKKA